MVDDNADQTTLLELALRKRYHVRVCNDLAGFTSALDEQLPELLLIDLHIGPHEASDLLAILEERATARIPVILTTGDVNGDAHAQDLGCAGMLRKPFTLREMHALIERLLPAE